MDAGQDWGANVVEGAEEQRVRQRQNATILLLARPTRELSRRLRHPAVGIVVGVVVVAVEMTCLLILFPGNPSLFQSVARSVIVLPAMYQISLLVFFPLRSVMDSVSALVQSAARGASHLAPTALPQPTPLDPDDLPVVGQTIGAIVPLRALEVAQVVDGAELALYFAAALTLLVGSVLAVLSVILVVSATSEGEALLGSGIVRVVAVFLLGMGIWCIRGPGRGDGWRTPAIARFCSPSSLKV